MTRPERIVDLLRQREWRVAVAESCTGGMLGAALTSVAGASAVFPGGIIAYSDDVKRELLEVSSALIENHGAVSGAVVEAMAHGVRDALGTDVGVAVSGIAGPLGATPGKPVGTVWVAVVGPGRLITVHRYVFDGDRPAVRRQAVDAALELAAANLDEAVADLQAANPIG